MEKITLSTLIAIHQGMNVINLGIPGQGKSYCTKGLCDMLGINYTLVAGHKSPKDFFEVFKNDGLIIIDESATLIRNPKIMDMLLSALWDGSVEWSNNRKQETIHFTGQIIFNTNSIPNSEFMRALKDRCLFNKILLSSGQLKKILFKKEFNYKTAWKIIKKRVEQDDIALESDDKIKIKEIIKRLQLKSLRTPIKINKIANFLKTVFGNIDKIGLFLDEGEGLYAIILDKNIKDSEKVKKISTLKNVSIRQARNIFRKYKSI